MEAVKISQMWGSLLLAKTSESGNEAEKPKFTFEQAKVFVSRALAFEMGKKPVYNEHNKAILRSLTAYFFGFEDECEKHKIELSKGVCLYGPVGCGKTKIMRAFMAVTRSFNMTDTRKIGFEFAKSGFESLERYGRNSFKKGTGLPIDWCFDDFGVEGDYKFYANHVNIMADIVLCRYDHLRTGMKTHITTNLNSEQCREKYGERVESRMHEMFNVIKFGNESTDFRK